MCKHPLRVYENRSQFLRHALPAQVPHNPLPRSIRGRHVSTPFLPLTAKFRHLKRWMVITYKCCVWWRHFRGLPKLATGYRSRTRVEYSVLSPTEGSLLIQPKVGMLRDELRRPDDNMAAEQSGPRMRSGVTPDASASVSPPSESL